MNGSLRWSLRSLRNLAAFVLSVPLLGFNLFVRVRLVRIYSSRIGHLCYNLDNYHHIIHHDLKPRRTWTIVIPDDRIANRDVWRRIQRALPGTYLAGRAGSVARRLIGARSLTRFVVPWTDLHPSFSRIGLSDPWVVVGAVELRSTLSAAGVAGSPYVLLHNRDNAYLSAMGEDGNHHEARDFDFDDYLLAIDSVVQVGVDAVRIGTIQAHGFAGERLLDLSGTARKEEWDLPLVAGAQFFVTGNTGLAQLSTLLRRPHLYINYLPLRLDHMMSFSADSVLLPKRLRARQSGRFLTLGDTLSICSRWSIHYEGEYFADAGLEIVNNSPELIAEAVKEMLLRTQGLWLDQPEDLALHSRAVTVCGESEDSRYLFEDLRIRFSSSYLSEFPELVAH